MSDAGHAQTAGDNVGGPAPSGEAEGQNGGVDQAALAELTSQFANTTQEQLREMLPQLMAEQFQQLQGEPEQEQTGERDLDLSYMDPEERLAAERFLAEQDQRLQSQVQQALNPLQQQLTQAQQQMQEMKLQQQAAELVDEFPEIGEPETAKQVMQTASQWVESNNLPEELKMNPAIWRAAYMMVRFSDAANAEGEQAPAAHLEGAGGAGPAAPQVNLGDVIVNGTPDGQATRQGRGVLPNF